MDPDQAVPETDAGPGRDHEDPVFEESRLDEVRHLVSHTTARLLGDTISVSDEGWRAASRLPRWSRGHVATHVARNADAF